MNNLLSYKHALKAIKHIEKDKNFELPYHRGQDPMCIILHLYSMTF